MSSHPSYLAPSASDTPTCSLPPPTLLTPPPHASYSIPCHPAPLQTYLTSSPRLLLTPVLLIVSPACYLAPKPCPKPLYSTPRPRDLPAPDNHGQCSYTSYQAHACPLTRPPALATPRHCPDWYDKPAGATRGLARNVRVLSVKCHYWRGFSCLHSTLLSFPLVPPLIWASPLPPPVTDK